MSQAKSTKPPGWNPSWTLASDLNADELEAMLLAGRTYDASNLWLLPEDKVAAKIKSDTEAAAAALHAKMNPVIPKPSPEVLARIEAAQKVQSSFEAEVTTTTGRQVKVETPGGVKVETPKIDNADWAGKPKETPIEFADKERYLGHLLGGQHFEKTFSLFAGKLSVTFRTLSCSEQESVARQIWLDYNHETSWAKDERMANSERLARFAQYLFTAALYKIQAPNDVSQQFEPFKAAENKEAHVLAIRTAHKQVQDVFPWPIYRVLMDAHAQFCDLVNKLGAEAQNPSFWSPDAGA